MKRKSTPWRMKEQSLLYRATIQGGPIMCRICGEPIRPMDEVEYDHQHEIADGGKHEYENLAPVHLDPCHRNKTRDSSKSRAHHKRLRKPKKKSLRPIPKRKDFKWPERKMQNRKYLERSGG